MKITFNIEEKEITEVELEGNTHFKDVLHTIEVIVNDLHIEHNISKDKINVVFKDATDNSST